MKCLGLFFNYFGGKWRIADRYPAPSHRVLIEPFAGSAGYALHHPDRQVRLYDVDPVVCGVWDYLIRARESEILALPPAVTDLRAMDLPQEARWLIGFWLNKGATPCHRPDRWMRDGTRPNSFWGEAIRARIASQVQYIRHWTVEQRSYEAIEDSAATWFVDPPYAVSGHKYRFGAKGIDFQKLGTWCASRSGEVIVCEQAGATWLPFEPIGSYKSLEGRFGKKQTHEVAWFQGIGVSPSAQASGRAVAGQMFIDGLGERG